MRRPSPCNRPPPHSSRRAPAPRAFEGAEVVFHMSAPDSSMNKHLIISVNVEGTKKVIEACICWKVKRLIYKSSPSVVFDGVHGIFNADRSMPQCLPASPGAAVGSIVCTAEDAEAWRAKGKSAILLEGADRRSLDFRKILQDQVMSLRQA